jgi:anti-sigma-K factor RskA
MDADPGAGPPDDAVLAGEYVLGVLDGDERRRVQARLRQDGAFASQVARWEHNLAPWLAEVAPVPVPAHLWGALSARLGWREERPERVGLWRSLLAWRTATVLAILAAVAVWVAHPPGSRTSQETALTRPVTPLAQSDGKLGWLASVDQARGTVLMVPVPRSADAQGRVAELWVIPAGKAPLSLGAVSLTRSHTVDVPANARAALTAPGSVLAITLEPPAGLPHRAPSGPIIASGPIQI